MRARGVLQPVLVRPLPGGRYELVAGERRLRAAKLAGLERVPALVRSTEESERLELALIENMARQDLNPVDAARACAALVDELGLSKEEIGRRVGRSRAAISNMVRLLELPDEVLAMLESGELSEGHGRAILQLRDRNGQRALARRARDEALSVRETEALARAGEAPQPAAPRGRPALVAADALEACRELEESLGDLIGARCACGRAAGARRSRSLSTSCAKPAIWSAASRARSRLSQQRRGSGPTPAAPYGNRLAGCSMRKGFGSSCPARSRSTAGRRRVSPTSTT